MNFVEDLAFQFHEEWRKTRLNADGTYEPRWKVIKDEEYIQNYEKAEHKPSYVRKNENGQYEMDIANVHFNFLSKDWQAENRAAAEVVANLVKSNKKYSTKKIGNIIHNAWLERNTWAKGGELDVPFKKLSKEEQQKDLVQYETAAKMYEAYKHCYDIFDPRDGLGCVMNFLRNRKEEGENIAVSWRIYNGKDFESIAFYALFDDEDAIDAKLCADIDRRRSLERSLDEKAKTKANQRVKENSEEETLIN